MRVTLIFLFSVFVFCFLSCNDEEDKMEYAKIYFPLATRADINEMFRVNFDYTRDTTFIVRVYCAGSILTPDDVAVEVQLATDKLQEKQSENLVFADYELLPTDAYTIDPSDLKLVIKKNTESVDLRVMFQTSKLAEGKKYILPLFIKSVSRYEVSDKYGLLFFAIQ